ncbi:MAG: SRPBCC family protein [Bacteroidota bacterium]
MPTIQITTHINAPIARCFDLSRSIDLHQLSTSKTNERAISGFTTGLINKGDQVTWEATHFGIRQKLTSLISEMDSPNTFTDVQLKGAFKYFRHQHFFEYQNGQTIMKDVFEFESPLGFLGNLFNKLILTDYMSRFLTERNQVIKHMAESDEWKKYV